MVQLKAFKIVSGNLDRYHIDLYALRMEKYRKRVESGYECIIEKGFFSYLFTDQLAV